MIPFYSVAYCQVTAVDSGYYISREYANFIALKFDSLDAYKLAYKNAVSAADTCSGLLNYSQRVISEQDIQYKLQIRQIQAQTEMIESFKRSELVHIDTQKHLKTEVRRRKAWKATAITFGSLFATSLLYISIRWTDLKYTSTAYYRT